MNNKFRANFMKASRKENDFFVKSLFLIGVLVIGELVNGEHENWFV